MINDIDVGDRVKLLGVPHWLIHDLPLIEQEEICAFIGQYATVEKVDSYGYFWLGFGKTTEVDEVAYYSGHSFCVPREFIERDVSNTG